MRQYAVSQSSARVAHSETKKAATTSRESAAYAKNTLGKLPLDPERRAVEPTGTIGASMASEPARQKKIASFAFAQAPSQIAKRLNHGAKMYTTNNCDDVGDNNY